MLFNLVWKIDEIVLNILFWFCFFVFEFIICCLYVFDGIFVSSINGFLDVLMFMFCGCGRWVFDYDYYLCKIL